MHTPASTALLVGAILIVFFQNILNAFTRSTIFGYLDELFIAVLIAGLIIYSLLRAKVHQFFLAIVVVLGYMILISLLFGAQKDVFKIVMQSVMHLKFFIFLFFFYVILKRVQINAITILKYLLGIAMFGLLLELVLKNTFFDLMQVDEYLRPYSKQDKVVYGGFIKANALSLLMLVFFAGRAYLDNNLSTKKFLLWAAVLFAFFIAVRSRTPILLLLILVMIRFGKKLLKPVIIFPLIITFTTAFIVLATKTNFIEKSITNIALFFTKDSYYIRGIMYYLSGEVSSDYFPIGSGAATFGTALSAESPVYEAYDVAGRSFFINMDGVYDSNFASVLGEFGWIGIGLMITLFVLSKMLFRDRVGHRGFFFILIAITIFYAIISPLLMNSYFAMVLALGFAVLFDSKFSKIENTTS